MEDTGRRSRGHRRGLSTGRQRLLWAALASLVGAAVASDSAAAVSWVRVLFGAAVGAGTGAALARQLSHAMPVFGVVIGPMLTLMLMNLQRFTTSDTTPLPSVTRRASTQQLDMAMPSLGYVAAGIGVLASALLASILLHALSLRIRGDRRPMRHAFRGLAWICFWISLATILISNFAPV